MRVCGIIFLIMVSFRASAQCAMCRAVLESSNNHSEASAINNGIVYLMSIPYVLVVVIGFFIYRSYIRRKKKDSL